MESIQRFEVISAIISVTYHFRQDYDPKHAAKKTREWALCNVYTVLNTPEQSSDTIEKLGHLLDLEVMKMKITKKHDLS